MYPLTVLRARYSSLHMNDDTSRPRARRDRISVSLFVNPCFLAISSQAILYSRSEPPPNAAARSRALSSSCFFYFALLLFDDTLVGATTVLKFNVGGVRSPCTNNECCRTDCAGDPCYFSRCNAAAACSSKGAGEVEAGEKQQMRYCVSARYARYGCARHG